MVQLEVPPESADKLASALGELTQTGLAVTVAKSAGAPTPGKHRLVQVQLVGDDRVGIVSRVANLLAGNNISIEQLATELQTNASGRDAFRIHARLLVPASLSTDDLRAALGGMAQELTLDFSLDEPL
jgi:methionyl-tRNA formyltransferase